MPVEEIKELDTEELRRRYTGAAIPVKSTPEHERIYEKYNSFCNKRFGSLTLSEDSIKCFIVHSIYDLKAARKTAIKYASIM